MPSCELRWAATPKGLVKQTPWGWQSMCTCDWVQDDGRGVHGTRKNAHRAWHRHAHPTTQGGTAA